MPLVTGVVVLVFGGLTLWLQDDTFIKMKPTITNALFGAVLAGRAAVRPVAAQICVRRCLQAAAARLVRADAALGRCSFSCWRIVNEILWRNFSTDIWVAFKVWGVMPLTVLFSMLQVPTLNKYAPPAEPPPIVVES